MKSMSLDEHVTIVSSQGFKASVCTSTQFSNSYVLRTLFNTEKFPLFLTNLPYSENFIMQNKKSYLYVSQLNIIICSLHYF